MVRAVQRLESGGDVVFMEGPAGVPSAEMGPAEGLSRATTRKGGLVITATAPVTLEELEALLKRLR